MEGQKQGWQEKKQTNKAKTSNKTTNTEKKKKVAGLPKNGHNYLKISPCSVGVIRISREKYTCLKRAMLHICNSHSGSTPNLFEDQPLL